VECPNRDEGLQVLNSQPCWSIQSQLTLVQLCPGLLRMFTQLHSGDTQTDHAKQNSTGDGDDGLIGYHPRPDFGLP